MKETILKSATKIVFILMAIALIVFTFIWIVEAKDFIQLINLVFAYYFIKQANEKPKVDENKNLQE